MLPGSLHILERTTCLRPLNYSKETLPLTHEPVEEKTSLPGGYRTERTALDRLLSSTGSGSNGHPH